MKLKFKTQAYQTAAVQAVVDCQRHPRPCTTALIRVMPPRGRPLAAR